MKRIAILTSGGDAPGMNAAIRAATRTAIGAGAEVLGVCGGYRGLIQGDFRSLSARDVGGIIELGGTILESARCLEFRTTTSQERALAVLDDARVSGLIVIGGNGSQTGAHALSEAGLPVNGIASTIDNDLLGSEMTIGVDTALNTALEAIDRLRTTATSHHRLFVTEVMGRDCGYLALAVALAGGAEVVVTPEHLLPIEDVIKTVHMAYQRGKRHAMVIVAEGVHGYAHQLHQALCKDLDSCFDPRLTILGHTLRGGRPTAFDRLLGTRLGSRAAELLMEGVAGNLIGLQHSEVVATPLAEVIGRIKPLPQEFLRLIDTMKL